MLNMPHATLPSLDQSFAALRRFARKRSPEESCELCSAPLAHEHPHLLELASRKIICACDACSLLFDGYTAGKFKRVSRRIWMLEDFQLSEGEWESLLIPINLAFFFYSTVHHRMVALYPSPAGAIESELSLDAWNEIVANNPLLSKLEPDVEALLVNRVGATRGSSPAEYFMAPMDECYRLVGLIRTHWKGFSGGSEVWDEIAHFFAVLRARGQKL